MARSDHRGSVDEVHGRWALVLPTSDLLASACFHEVKQAQGTQQAAKARKRAGKDLFLPLFSAGFQAVQGDSSQPEPSQHRTRRVAGRSRGFQRFSRVRGHVTRPRHATAAFAHGGAIQKLSGS